MMPEISLLTETFQYSVYLKKYTKETLLIKNNSKTSQNNPRTIQEQSKNNHIKIGEHRVRFETPFD